MNHLTMTINDEQIQVKEYQGTRVVTLPISTGSISGRREPPESGSIFTKTGL